MKLTAFITKPLGLLFLGIIILATLIRFTSLSSLPISLYWDEVSEGYNSYSILHTGKDEYGTSFPLLFRAYDDFKMPVYIYLSVIPIALFGLNEFSVRFLSAISGVGSVVACFFLVRELFREEKFKDFISLFSAFLFSIVPWHIQLSRVGFEANIALFFAILGAFFTVKAAQSKFYLLAASGAFLLSIYSYRSSLIVIPLLFFVFIVILRSDLMKKSRQRITLLALGIFILLSLPLAFTLLKNGDTRSSEVSIFAVENSQIRENSIRQQQAGNTVLAKLIYNRRLVYLREVTSNYFLHFSPNFLFLKGDVNPRHSLGDMGLLYLWQMPFVITGLLFLLSKYRRQALFLLAWLLLSPLPASFSLPAPHALRSLLMLPPLLVFTAAGVYFVYQLCRSNWKSAYVLGLAVVIMSSSWIYAQKYIVHNGTTASTEWGDGYKELIETIKPQLGVYDKVIISGHYWQPYMYTLFYTGYDPLLYQQKGSQEGFGIFLFGGTSWDQRLHRKELDSTNLSKLAQNKNVLVALSPSEYKSQMENVKVTAEVKNHLGQVVFILGTLQ